MTTCWACDAELDPAWKYCIRCGVPAEKESAVPAAIRPAGGGGLTAGLSPLAVFGWIIAGSGAALLIVGIVLVFFLHK